MTCPKVTIIILNWNGKEDTIECLESLKHITYPNYDVLLVENGSTDGSVEYFREMYPEIEMIENRENLGFAEGNNVGIRYAFKEMNPKYIVTLNNDMVVTSNWLTELIKVIELDENIGSCSSKILFYNERNVINSTGILILKDGAALDRGRNERDIDQYNRIEEVFGACAGAAVYRKEALEEVGLFDEDYFAYYEDVDLAWRLRLKSWKCIYVPKAITYHKYSRSGGQFSLFKVYQGERNRIWNVIKNYPGEYVILAPFYNIAKNTLLLSASINGKGRGTLYSKNHSLYKIVITMLRAKIDALVKLPHMLKKRKAIKISQTIEKYNIKKWFSEYSIDLKDVPYK